MTRFRFYHPINVRYGDLDPQGHVNNAKYLTYIEQARIAYIQNLDLWDGRSFLDVGIILADARLTFRAPILLSDEIRTGVRISRLGRKSFEMEYVIEAVSTGRKMADAATTLVTYDYRQGKTILIPAHWRTVINAFEELPEKTHPEPSRSMEISNDSA
jgi:acyl-CoA thioester hydrolase